MTASTDLDTLTDFFDRYGVGVPGQPGGAVSGERYRYLLRATDDGPAICTVIRTA